MTSSNDIGLLIRPSGFESESGPLFYEASGVPRVTGARGEDGKWRPFLSACQGPFINDVTHLGVRGQTFVTMCDEGGRGF